jgi:hypothetical protein
MDSHKADLRAAYTGLIVGALSLLLIVVGIVKIVDAAQAGKAEAHTTTPH